MRSILRVRVKIIFFVLRDLILKTSISKVTKWLIAKCFLLSSCAPPITGVASICLKVIEQVTDGSLPITLKAHQLGKILVLHLMSYVIGNYNRIVKDTFSD